MSVFMTLLKKDFLNMFSFRRFFQGKKWLLVLGGFGFLVGVAAIVFYEYLFLQLTISIQMPILFFFLIGIVEYVMGIFTSIRIAPGYLFQCKDYDLLFAMPIKRSTILLEKIAQLYLYNLQSTLLFCLPAVVLYGIFVGPTISFYFFALPLFLVVPIIPSLIGALIAFIFMWISAKFKYVKFINTALYVLFFLAIVFGSGAISGFASGGGDADVIVNALTGTMNQWFLKPILWFSEGIIFGNLKSTLLLIGTSIIALFLFSLVFSITFSKINISLTETPQKSNYKMREQKRSGVFSSLIRKELGFATINNVVILNVFMGPLLGLLFTIGICVGYPYLEPEAILADSGIPVSAAEKLPGIMELVHQNMGIAIGIILLMFFYFLNLAVTSCFSISIEGKSFWLTKSIPVPVSTIFRSKWGFQLFISLPVAIISVLLLTITFKLPIIAVALLIFPLILDTVLSAKIGLYLNLLFPKMHWEQPAAVVKQSASTTVAVFAHMIGVAIAAGAYILLYMKGILFTGAGLHEGTDIFIVLFMVIQILLIALVTLLLQTDGKRRFAQIEA